MAATIAMELTERIGPSQSVGRDSEVHPFGPTTEEIAKLAYSLWEARGGMGGSAEDDWLAAEAELSKIA